MKHRSMATIAFLLAGTLSLFAFSVNYNASKSNTGNIVVHTSSVTEAQAAAILAEIDKSRQAPTEAALRSLMTAQGIKQGKMKLIIQQKDGKNIVLMLDDPADEKKARDAANSATSRSNAQQDTFVNSTSRSNTSHNLTISCKGPDGKPCNAAQVQAINSGLATGRRQHPLLADVQGVTLANDGTLNCVQNNGQPCTQAQLDAVAEVANSKRCAINYNASKSNTGNIVK